MNVERREGKKRGNKGKVQSRRKVGRNEESIGKDKICKKAQQEGFGVEGNGTELNNKERKDIKSEGALYSVFYAEPTFGN